MVEVIKIMVKSSKRSCACNVILMPSTLQQATTDLYLCWRLLETYRQIWFSLLKGHCSFLLGPGAHKVLFVPSKSLLYFQFLCKFWQLYGGVNGDLLQESLCLPKSAAPRAPAPAAVHC